MNETNSTSWCSEDTLLSSNRSSYKEGIIKGIGYARKYPNASTEQLKGLVEQTAAEIEDKQYIAKKVRDAYNAKKTWIAWYVLSIALITALIGISVASTFPDKNLFAIIIFTTVIPFCVLIIPAILWEHKLNILEKKELKNHLDLYEKVKNEK